MSKSYQKTKTRINRIMIGVGTALIVTGVVIMLATGSGAGLGLAIVGIIMAAAGSIFFRPRQT